ncbi:MAG: D-glucuronyl C5-epimerase family protein [Bacteroidia bacterium]
MPLTINRNQGLTIQVNLLICALTLLLLIGVGFSQHPKLPRYSCFTEQIDPRLWLLQYERRPDTAGIIMQKGEYHPLSICLFGIMHYDRFKETADSNSYKNVIAQFQYFLQKGRLEYSLDGKRIGLPYRYNYKDMKAPWYSGMTQGVALSYLLRYYDLTGDTAALNMTPKIAQMMLEPVNEGGTLSKTPEGYPWIEEYPGTTLLPQVLNGFINGLIGLYEYTLFFPDDTLARKVHDQTYASLCKTLPSYDSHEWTNYCRQTRYVTDQYMRYEQAQMAHLAEVYHNPQFIRQLQIWGHWAYGRYDRVITCYRRPEYQFSEPLELRRDTMPRFAMDRFLRATEPIPDASLSIGPKNSPKVLKSRKKSQITLPDSTTWVELTTKVPSGAAYNVTGEIVGRPSVEMQVLITDSSLIFRSSKPIQLLHLTAADRKQPEITLEQGRYFSLRSQSVPMFVFDTLNRRIYLDSTKTYMVNLDAENVCEPTVFYRHSRTRFVEHEIAKWNTEQVITDLEQPFSPPVSGWYSFFYSFPYWQPDPVVRSFQVEEMRKN